MGEFSGYQSEIFDKIANSQQDSPVINKDEDTSMINKDEVTPMINRAEFEAFDAALENLKESPVEPVDMAMTKLEDMTKDVKEAEKQITTGGNNTFDPYDMDDTYSYLN